MPDTFSNLAVMAAARAPGVTIGWRAGAPVSNAQFVARIGAWSALLERQAGSDFALYLDDSIEFGAALLGAWQAGKTIWLCADTLAASCAALAGSVHGFLGQFPAACEPLLPAASDQSGAAMRPLAPGFGALVVHTSGSTGAAQAIPKRCSQLASEVAVLEALFGQLAGDAAMVATVSHQHIYGLLFTVLWPLAAGRAIHAHSLKYPEQLAALLSERPCILVTSPAHLKRLPDHLSLDAARHPLRAVFSSGGPLAPEAARASGRLLGCAPLEIYGSSETGGIAWRQRCAGSDESWQAFPNVGWRVAGDGLLEVRSPHLADDAWLRLADRAQESEAGRFLLLGRSDRIVKIEEKRISLDAIEAALMQSPLVTEARVLPCPPLAGQRQKLAAFVVASDAGRALLAGSGKLALNRLLSSALSGLIDAVAMPRRWRYLDQMPLDAQGKTTQAGLLALLDGGSVRPRTPQVRLLERAPERVLLELTVPSNLFYFDGHFPDAPILAGVVQVDWAIAYGRQYFHLPAQFLALHGLKFQQVIRAGQPVRLELLHDTQKGNLNFRYLSGTGQHAGGRILFGPEPTLPGKGTC